LNAFQALGLKILSELEPFKPMSSTPSPHSLTILTLWIFQTKRHIFTKEALKKGYSEQNIQRCFGLCILFSNDLPVIYNTSHLSVLVGYKKEYLKKAALHTKYFYRDFEILKRNGKKRSISEPLPSLKEIQHWVLKKHSCTIFR
jgi:RNA-directed DNA polymerase